MIIHYKSALTFIGTKLANHLIMLIVLTSATASAQTYTFTSAGVTGQTGPTQLQVTTAYQNSNLSGSVTVASGIQSFTVPATGMYRIQALGAQGAGASGGNGAMIAGDFSLSVNDVLRIVVGQQGVTQANEPNACGGGGGSYVLTGVGNTTANILVIAGGGGGSPASYSMGKQASTSTTGNNGAGVDNTDGAGGINGNGGNKSVSANSLDRAAGGGGFFTNGQSIGQTPGAANGGDSFINGSLGGSISGAGAAGGFGGGGAVWTTGFRGGGGGGGYSGGGGGQTNSNANTHSGGGGGSFNSGINQTNTVSLATGDGSVIITKLCNISLTAAGTTTNGFICTGSSATLSSNAVSNYVWSDGSTGSSLVVSPTITTSYSLTATSASACVASNMITIFVNNTPTVTTVLSSSNVCAGRSVTMTASGANSYAWTGGVTNAMSYTPSATGSYTVTGTNACGTATAAVSITVQPAPSVSVNATNTMICSGSTVVISGSGATSYTLLPNVGYNTTFTPGATANYTLTGLGANNCTNTAVVQIVVINNPTVNPVASPSVICVGSTVNLSAVGATGYTWSAQNWAGSNLSSVVVSPTANPTTYSLTRVNGICTTNATVNVVVNAFPILSLSPPATVCACTGSANLTVVGGITATWQPSGAQGNNLVVYPCVSTNYIVSASSSQGCISSSVIPITVAPNPVISIIATSPSICVGGTVGLNVTGAPTFSWSRSTVPNVFIPMGINPSFIDNPTNNAQYVAAGTSTDGCTTSASTVIVVRENPTLTVSSSAPYACNGNSTTLTAANGVSTSVTTFSWSTNQIASSIVVSPVSTTNYSVKATYTSGCSTSSVFPLSVYIATFAVNTPSAICRGTTYTLTASGGASTFTWGTSPVQTGSMAIVSPTTTTTYTVKGAAGQCSVVNTVTVNVNPLPPVNISTPRWVICLFDEVQLTANGALTYSWTNPDGTFDTNPTITFAATGNGGPNGNPTQTTSFTLTGVDGNGCTRKVVSTVYVSNCTRIDEQDFSASFLNVYPNPNNGEFVIKSDMPMQLNIINELGQTVREVSVTENTTEVIVSGLANGVYFITGQSEGNRIATKLVVNK